MGENLDPKLITFRPINLTSIDDFECLAKWDNDPEIRHLIIPKRNDEPFKNIEPESLRLQTIERATGGWSFLLNDLVLYRYQPIGNCNIIFDPPHKITDKPKVAWFGITIGEAAFRRRGIGKLVVRHMEEEAKKSGASVFEVGVFEFNDSSKKLFLSMGYRVIAEKPNSFYWNGAMWSDIRLTKAV